MANEKRPATVEDIPDDPLKMPPPYWRSSGAIFHVLAALEAIAVHLSHLIPLLRRTNRKLTAYFDKYPPEEDESDAAYTEFGDIRMDLTELEHLIRMESERAVLMSAIAAEDETNQFCVFNLHRDVAESMEKLSLMEKLLIASGALGKHGVKSTAVYENARKLTTWRNAFAHGHCVDRPVKSLRHNHLIAPDEYPGVPGAVNDAIEYVRGFLNISSYLRSISLNPSTGGVSGENENLEMILSKISEYSFKGDNIVYSVRRIPIPHDRKKRQAPKKKR